MIFLFPSFAGESGCGRRWFVAFSSPFLIENGGKGGKNPEAASELFFRLGVDAVHKFQMAVYHPLGRPSGVGAAEELEGCPYGNQNTAVQMRLHFAHEDLLFGSAQRHPDDVGLVPLDDAGQLFVVKIIYITVGQVVERHVCDARVRLRQVLFQSGQRSGRGAHEDHAVFPHADNVHEDLAAAVLSVAFAVEPFQIERDIAAVADGEHASVDDVQIVGIAVGGGQDDAVRHADVAGFVFFQLAVDGAKHLRLVKLVVDVKVFLHIMWCVYAKVSRAEILKQSQPALADDVGAVFASEFFVGAQAQDADLFGLCPQFRDLPLQAFGRIRDEQAADAVGSVSDDLRKTAVVRPYAGFPECGGLEDCHWEPFVAPAGHDDEPAFPDEILQCRAVQFSQEPDVFGKVSPHVFSDGPGKAERYVGMPAGRVYQAVIAFLIAQPSHIAYVFPRLVCAAVGHIGAVGDDCQAPAVESGGRQFPFLKVRDAGKDINVFPIGPGQAGVCVSQSIAGGFEQGVLAVMPQAAPFVPALQTDFAGRAVPHEKSGGAYQPEVVYGHDNRDPGFPAFLQGRRTDERVEIVHIHDIGSFPAECLAHTSYAFGRVDAAEESFYFPSQRLPASLAGLPVEGDVDAARLQHLRHFVDHGLLAAVFPVVVVYKEYFHRMMRLERAILPLSNRTDYWGACGFVVSVLEIIWKTCIFS